ncbi:hypothetical protein C1N58_07645 [Pantoea sp. SGAir0180]
MIDVPVQRLHVTLHGLFPPQPLRAVVTGQYVWPEAAQPVLSKARIIRIRTALGCQLLENIKLFGWTAMLPKLQRAADVANLDPDTGDALHQFLLIIIGKPLFILPQARLKRG